jgi:hypothetical protein
MRSRYRRTARNWLFVTGKDGWRMGTLMGTLATVVDEGPAQPALPDRKQRGPNSVSDVAPFSVTGGEPEKSGISVKGQIRLPALDPSSRRLLMYGGGSPAHEVNHRWRERPTYRKSPSETTSEGAERPSVVIATPDLENVSDVAP